MITDIIDVGSNDTRTHVGCSLLYIRSLVVGWGGGVGLGGAVALRVIPEVELGNVK